MPILTRREARPTNVLCVREIRVGTPPERFVDVEQFYTAILGLSPWPEDLQVPGGWGVGHPQRGLLLQFRHDPVVDPVRRRFAVSVDDLDALEQRLQERQWPHRRVRGLSLTDCSILLHDPAGHLIEARQSQPL